MIWLVLEKDDPFVAGGVPRYATTDEQAAWDWLAETVAQEGYARWRFEQEHGFPRATLWQSTANELAGWELGWVGISATMVRPPARG